MLDLIIDVKYSDITFVEAKGNYKNMKRIFDNEPVGSSNWMVVSDISILWQTEPEHPFPMSGFFEARLHAFHDGNLVLNDCIIPKGISRDIEVFSSWAQLNHWNVPKISNELAKPNLLYWEHYWITGLLECDLLDKKYGSREALQSSPDSDN